MKDGKDTMQKRKCEICGKKLNIGDKVIMTYTLEDSNFSYDPDTYAQNKTDKRIFACVDCCENMNFREVSK